jgi:hypothetical protein
MSHLYHDFLIYYLVIYDLLYQMPFEDPCKYHPLENHDQELLKYNYNIIINLF